MNKCVCCEKETNGTYGGKFPVCFECYDGDNLSNLFYAVLSHHTKRLNKSFVEYTKEIHDAAQNNFEYLERLENEKN